MKKSKTLIIVIVALCIVALGYLILNNSKQTNEKNKPNVKLIVKTPVLQMSCYTNPEIKDSYTLMKKVAKMFEEQYKDARVTVDVIQFAKVNEDDEIVGCYDTERETDVLFEEFFNMSTYIHTGRVVPLDDIISEELRNDINDSYWENSSLNGKTYMMPYLGMQNVLSYNKDMFRQAGLSKYITDEDVIQSWSLEDWDKILSALKNKLPENTYPIMMYGKDQMGDTHVMTFLRSRGSKFFDEDGKIKLTTKEGIQAVQWLMDCNKKGYFPQNAENLNVNDCFNLFTNGQSAINLNNIVLNETIKQTNLNYGFVNFPSVDGKGFNTTFITGFEVFDNGDKIREKVAKDFVKFVYETDEILELSVGAIPCSSKVTEKYKDEFKEITKFADNAENGWNFTGNNPDWRKVREVFYPNIQELLYGEKTAEEIAKQIEDTCNKALEEGYANSKLHE